MTGRNRPWDASGILQKGNSLTSECMRNIQIKMLNFCSESGIHILCVTFDGQWYKLKDESTSGFPLTMFQSQRLHWNEICKLSKDQIINELCAGHKEVITESLSGQSEVSQAIIFASSGDRKLQFPRVKLQKERKSYTEQRHVRKLRR